ncbi:hypothetical protein, partial [Novosphingobium guangzhouense]|uniref:hypothetical protein n=1 Tax=Novosphingobium guangzhouense TaxID=1850347 RepID=UPI001B801F23
VPVRKIKETGLSCHHRLRHIADEVNQFRPLHARGFSRCPAGGSGQRTGWLAALAGQHLNARPIVHPHSGDNLQLRIPPAHFGKTRQCFLSCANPR